VAAAGINPLIEPFAARNLIIRWPKGVSSQPGAAPPMDEALRRRYGLDLPTAAKTEPKATNTSPDGITEVWRTETQQLDEDLTVMSRILEKAIERELGIGGDQDTLGIVLSGAKDRRPANFYLQGYGAVFVLHVPFPLTSQERKPEPETKRSSDSAWEETRKELLETKGQIEPQVDGPWTGGFGGVAAAGDPVPPQFDYEPERVEKLKQTLFAALKSAANIRHMAPEEVITIVVQSVRANPMITRFPGGMDVRLAQRYGLDRVYRTTGVRIDARNGDSPSRQLVIQASRSLIQAVESGKTKPEVFARRVDVAIY
jgi:hypothetical protein